MNNPFRSLLSYDNKESQSESSVYLNHDFSTWKKNLQNSIIRILHFDDSIKLKPLKHATATASAAAKKTPSVDLCPQNPVILP